MEKNPSVNSRRRVLIRGPCERPLPIVILQHCLPASLGAVDPVAACGSHRQDQVDGRSYVQWSGHPPTPAA